MGREWLVSLNVGLGRLGYRPQYGTGMINGIPECRPRQARL